MVFEIFAFSWVYYRKNHTVLHFPETPLQAGVNVTKQQAVNKANTFTSFVVITRRVWNNRTAIIVLKRRTKLHSGRRCTVQQAQWCSLWLCCGKLPVIHSTKWSHYTPSAADRRVQEQVINVRGKILPQNAHRSGRLQNTWLLLPTAAVHCQTVMTREGLVDLPETSRLNTGCFHAFMAHEKTASCSSVSTRYSIINLLNPSSFFPYRQV